MVDTKLLVAYRATSFSVEAPDHEITLFVSEPSRAIDTLFESYDATTCAFITAWNPGSVRLEASDNKQRQADQPIYLN